MARSLDELMSNQERARDVYRLLNKPEIIDPSAPSSIIDLLDEERRRRDEYLKAPGTRPFDPSRMETRVPPSLNTRMAAKGDQLPLLGGYPPTGPSAPVPAGVSPEALRALDAAGWSTENVRPDTGLPAAATVIPQGLPSTVKRLPDPRIPEGFQIDKPLPASRIPEGFQIDKPAPKVPPDRMGGGMTRDLGPGIAQGLSQMAPVAPTQAAQAPPPTAVPPQPPPPAPPPTTPPSTAPTPVQTTTFQRPPVAPDAAGVTPQVAQPPAPPLEAPPAPSPVVPQQPAPPLPPPGTPEVSAIRSFPPKALQYQFDRMSSVIKELKTNPLDAFLSEDEAGKAVRSSGAAASAATWMERYRDVVNSGSLLSIAGLKRATTNLNSTLGTNVDAKEVIAQIRSDRAAGTEPPKPSGIGLQDVAAQQLLKLIQGQHVISKIASERVGQGVDLAKTPGDILQGKYGNSPFNTGPNDPLVGRAAQMGLDAAMWSTPFRGPNPLPPSLATPARTVEAAPGVTPRPPVVSSAQPAPGSLAELRATGGSARDIMQRNSAVQQRIDAGWTVNPRTGEWMPPSAPPQSLADIVAGGGRARSAGRMQQRALEAAGWQRNQYGELVPPGPGGM